MKLGKAQIKEIRAAYEAGEDQTSIATRYTAQGYTTKLGTAITNQTISYCLNRKSNRRNKKATNTQQETYTPRKSTNLLDVLVQSLTSAEKIKLISELSR